MTIEQAKALAQSRLSAYRFHHTQCVAECARALAPKFGADSDKAELAGWLHDILKEEEPSLLLKRLEGDDIIKNTDIMLCRALWHSWAGGLYVKQLGLGDDIADAVYYHTGGRAGMTALEKTLFLADYISLDRTFDGAAEVRAIAETDVEAALEAALAGVIEDLVKNKRFILPTTLEAYNWFVKERSLNG